MWWAARPCSAAIPTTCWARWICTTKSCTPRFATIPATHSGAAACAEHRQRTLTPPPVYEARDPVCPPPFPPIGGKRETASGNLPANLSSFLGRERELSGLLQLSHESRLITLVGPGGIGKTRLAIEFARSLESSFHDGAWLVDLSALERDSEVWSAIAEALLIVPVPGVERRIPGPD